MEFTQSKKPPGQPVSEGASVFDPRLGSINAHGGSPGTTSASVTRRTLPNKALAAVTVAHQPKHLYKKNGYAYQQPRPVYEYPETTGAIPGAPGLQYLNYVTPVTGAATYEVASVQQALRLNKLPKISVIKHWMPIDTNPY